MSEQSSREELLVKILNQAQALSAGIHPAIYRGHSPYIGENGNWYAYDDTLNAVVDTGVCAQGDEAARVAAELERAAAELSRAEGEQQRQAAEAARAGAEALRVQAEQLRAQAEAARGEAEAQRTSGETERAEAEAARVEAEAARTTAENARAEAELLRQAAKADMEAATAALQGMTAEAQTLPPGSAATAALSDVEGCKRLTLGLPEGQPGRSVASILRTAGTGAAGTTDTYTITYSDGATSTFTVYNGADGLGAGDMLAAAYDPDGDGKVEAADHADSANNATHAGSAAALDENAAVSMDQVSGLESALAGKQPTGNYLTAETDPTVPDWAKAQTKPAYTAAEVGAASARIAGVTLPSTGWSGDSAPYSQTIAIAGLTENGCVCVVAPTASSREAVSQCGLYVSDTLNESGQLTFFAEKAPGEELALLAMIITGAGDAAPSRVILAGGAGSGGGDYLPLTGGTVNGTITATKVYGAVWN